MKKYGALDRFRLIAALLVVSVHTSPLAGVSPIADFVLTRAVARLAVPFFMTVTGFFVLPELLYGDGKNCGRLAASLKKTGLIYLISVILYLPLGLYAGHYNGITPLKALKMLIFDGAFYHLWYLPAVMLGLSLIWLLSRFMRPGAIFAAAIFLYIVGLGGDSYYGLITLTPLGGIYGAIFAFSSYTRIFMAPLFLMMGAAAAKMKTVKKPLPLFVDLFAAMTAEALVLRSLDVQRHDSMYIFLPPCLWFLFQLLLGMDVKPLPCLRSASMVIYIVHPAAIVAVRLAAELTGLETLLVENALVHYLAVCALSGIAAVIWLLAEKRPDPPGRSRIELDAGALAHNVEALRERLPDGCLLMPVVKADAYGHGAVPISKELNRLGIRAFAVATVEEGARLRRGGIRGDILILGYTPPRQIGLVRRYRLIQTVTDLDYARELNALGRKVRVHLAVDTGMNRLGERADSENIFEMFGLKHLKIEGVFTHLCADDRPETKFADFTAGQTERFARLCDELEKRKIKVKKHILNSYGLFRYPEIGGDYARVGIALYGVLSDGPTTAELAADLKPVLTFRADIAQVKTVLPGENVGYGLGFTAERVMEVAVVAAGYADGVPRALSGRGEVLIKGRRAPMVGLICMDQFMVDVTGMDVRAGDSAVIIGSDGEERITACELADKCGTVANEIFSRLGSRPERRIVRGGKNWEKGFCDTDRA